MNINRLIDEELLTDTQLKDLLPYLYGRTLVNVEASIDNLCLNTRSPKPFVWNECQNRFNQRMIKKVLIGFILYKQKDSLDNKDLSLNHKSIHYLYKKYKELR